jgi:hypothetical protein
MDSDYPFGIFKLVSVVSMDSDYPFGIFKLFSVVSMDSDYPFGIFKLFSVESQWILITPLVSSNSRGNQNPLRLLRRV